VVADLQAFTGRAVLLLTPADDEPFGLAALLPALRVEAVDGVGHWPMLDRPESVDRLVEELSAPKSAQGGAP